MNDAMIEYSNFRQNVFKQIKFLMHRCGNVKRDCSKDIYKYIYNTDRWKNGGRKKTRECKISVVRQTTIIFGRSQNV